MTRKFLFKIGNLAAVAVVLLAAGCEMNNPYRDSERAKNYYYTTFTEPPKHLDPARSYSSNEYDFLAQIYEPPLQYHYLRRPYELVPLTAESVPLPTYFDVRGRRLPRDVSPHKVHRAVYTIKIKEDIMYQPHPAFATGPSGLNLYRKMTEKKLRGIDEVSDFDRKGTRELISDDYIYQIKRLADPQLHCPILPILTKYILGLDEYAAALDRDLKEIRMERRAAGGATFSQGTDERENPIQLDYDAHPLPGVKRVDDHTYRIILKNKYPQFVYWLAMPFFSPMPEEAIRFYKQGPLQKKNLTIDRFPVGTGAYRLDTFNPNMEMVMVRNENFRVDPYPAEGEEGDGARGLLDDAGKPLPFIDKIIFKLEKEDIPRWNKFLQGYYDSSGISSDSFDQAVSLSAEGSTEVTDFIKKKGIRLLTSVRPSTYYMGFNMSDDVVGGLTAERKKLRQAISIAINYEEYIEIFNNGRGIPAMSPLPPGIFGFASGPDGINPFVYNWDFASTKPKRKSIDEARRLLAEAGYPGGRDRSGKPLVITFDNAWTGVDSKPMINWYIKRLRLLGIQLENRTTDYNRFQDKMRKGNFQIFSWGWNADYPDPENFMFLLFGPNGKVDNFGENAANYASPDFDLLFRLMENMDNGEARGDIIRNMTGILQEDAPWVWGFHPVSFGLSHAWMGNIKSNSMANNTFKYLKVDAAARDVLRSEWNKPRLLPVAVIVVLFVAVSLPAAWTIYRRFRGV